MLNIIKNLDRNQFEPVLMTIYPEVEDGTSQLYKFQEVCRHIFVPVSKMDVLLKRDQKLVSALAQIKPDVIHSLGVFPDYAVSRIRKYPQIMTLRNYVWDDYPVKFGKVQGTLLAKLHLYAMTHTSKTVACSESLSNIYKEKLNMNYDYIRNGVDISLYTRAQGNEKSEIRRELGLPQDAFIFVYSGQIIDRKNQQFLLEVFRDTFKNNKVYLLLLGDGANYQSLSSQYGVADNIDFRGNVTDVGRYLKASDAYVSVSKSEGMPNGVLEAMATGLPVILSDIEQHKEVFSADGGIGFLYRQDDKYDLAEKMLKFSGMDLHELSNAAYESAHHNFDAKTNCRMYEKIYKKLNK